MTETSLSAAAQLYNYKCIGVTIKDYDIILFIGHSIRRVIFLTIMSTKEDLLKRLTRTSMSSPYIDLTRSIIGFFSAEISSSDLPIMGCEINIFRLESPVYFFWA